MGDQNVIVYKILWLLAQDTFRATWQMSISLISVYIYQPNFSGQLSYSYNPIFSFKYDPFRM